MTVEVAQRLAETVAWCSRHARVDEAGITTRTPALMPPVMAYRGYDLLKKLLDSPAETTAAVEHVCQARRRELTRLGIPVVPIGPGFAGGRILFTTIDTDSCGAATSPSNGFYDLDDLPGWDTWFLHARSDQSWGAIYCWVPAQLVALAGIGMDMIPVESVRWADPTRTGRPPSSKK
jgi:hypothetical protein